MSDALSKKEEETREKVGKERKRKREESEEEFYFRAARRHSRRKSTREFMRPPGENRTHLGRKTRAENILENYTAERASRAGRDGERRERERQSHSRNLLPPGTRRGSVAGISRVEVERRRFSSSRRREAPPRQGTSEKMYKPTRRRRVARA